MSISTPEVLPKFQTEDISQTEIDEYFDFDLPISEDEVPELELKENNFFQADLLRKARENDKNLDSVKFIKEISPIFGELKKSAKVRYLIVNNREEALEKIWKLLEEKVNLS